MGVEIERSVADAVGTRRSATGVRAGTRRLTAVLASLAVFGSLAIVGTRAESSSAEEVALQLELQAATATLKTQALATGEVPVVVELDVRAGASPETVKAAGARLVAEVGPVAGSVQILDNIGVVAMQATAEDLDQLARSGVVRRMEQDLLFAPSLSVSRTQVGATVAQSSGLDGAGYAVAVIDSGVDRNHPALAGKVRYEACFTSGSCPNGQSVQVDQAGAAAPCAWGDGCEHGTHVAGVVASGDPINRGIAPGASIVAVQVFSAASGASCGGRASCARARTSDVLAALDHLVEVNKKPGIRIVAANLSLSSDVTATSCDESILKGAIDRLAAADISTVVAAGNAGDTTRLGIPACISTAVAVGAVDANSAYWPVSNYGTGIDLMGPGVNVTSTWPGGSFRAASGTSTAAPHVAAALAVVAQALPNLTAAQRVDWLVQNGRPITGPAPEFTVKPLIDLSRLPRFQIQQASSDMNAGLVPVLGDYDGNGTTDIFFFDPRGQKSELWWYNLEGSVTKTPSTMSGDFRPVAGDFNRDGAEDIFWYSPTGASYYWFWQKGARTILGWNGPWYPFGDYRLVSGDFNRDGTDDIVFYAPSTGVTVYYWNQPVAAPQYARPIGQMAPSPGPGLLPVAGDLNGDGASEIVWIARSGSSKIWWYTNGGAVFSISVISQWAGSLAVGQFDQNPGLDLFFYNGGSSTLWTAVRPGVNGGDPLFQIAGINVQSISGEAFGGNFFGDSAKDEVLLYSRSGASFFLR